MVGTDATGSASAPMFIANDIAGGYTLTASSAYGSVTFSLINTATGIAATIVPQAPAQPRRPTSGAHYNRPLSVQVLDANGSPVEGASVVFALGLGQAQAAAAPLPPRPPGRASTAGRRRPPRRRTPSGIATSPLFSANGVAGSFTASATTAGVTEPADLQARQRGREAADRPP